MSESDLEAERYQHVAIVLLQALGVDPQTVVRSTGAVRLHEGTLYIDRHVRVMIDGSLGRSETVETLAIDISTDATLVAME